MSIPQTDYRIKLKIRNRYNGKFRRCTDLPDAGEFRSNPRLAGCKPVLHLHGDRHCEPVIRPVRVRDCSHDNCDKFDHMIADKFVLCFRCQRFKKFCYSFTPSTRSTVSRASVARPATPRSTFSNSGSTKSSILFTCVPSSAIREDTTSR